MIRYTRLQSLIWMSVSGFALMACGGGGGPSITPPPTVITPPPSVQPVTKGCAGRTTDALINTALASGDVGTLATDLLFDEIAGQLSCGVEDADILRAALFGLDEDLQPTSTVIDSLSWDPTHDAALLSARGDATVVLRSNAVTRTDRDVLGQGLVVAGERGAARHMVFGSNPMRTQYRGSAADGMDAFLRKSLDWLTAREDLETGSLSIVTAQMSQSFYFPDQVAVREWLDTQFGERVSVNAPQACDGPALASCLADQPDLLIISQTGDATGVAEAVEAALLAGTPVLYLHHDGNLTELGAELLPLLGTEYIGDNYWRNQSIADFNGTLDVGQLSPDEAALQTLLTHLRDDSFSFDVSACEDKSCPEGHAYTTEFLAPVQTLKTRFDAMDRRAESIFANDGHRIDKALVLLADRFRADVRFPMDKTATPRGDFLRALFADHVVHTARTVAPVQADLGNFSRSDFSHVTPVTKAVTLTARQYYSAAGVYALPGQTVRVTRTDDSDIATHIRVNLLRSGATHEFETNGYKRPKHLSSADMPIAPGETLSFTSPHGGPIQVRFDGKDVETRFTFEGVGEHAIWRGPEDDASFEVALDAGDYDWAELITPGFQVHSTLEKMRQTVDHPVWPSAAQVAGATERHLHNLPHVLAGFQGDGIDRVAEIEDFAAANGLSLRTLDTVKHMNADQANCGYGCSGNPYDAYWDFNPLGHGDIHELGHGLERGRFRYAGQDGHTSTNYYSYYSKQQFFAATGDTENLGCQSLPYGTIFDIVQASRNTADPMAYMQENLPLDWNYGAAINLQIMMAAQDLGLLDNGYHLLARQHIIDRDFNLADDSDANWAEMKDGLGFGDFTRAEARALSNNDWNLLALSHALDRDLSTYLERWGFELSAAAKAAVSDKAAFPTDFYIAGPTDHCQIFPTDKLPMDGTQSWPMSAKSLPVFKTAPSFHHAD